MAIKEIYRYTACPFIGMQLKVFCARIVEIQQLHTATSRECLAVHAEMIIRN